MEPIPEVRAAASRLSALADETMDLRAGLEAVSALAVALLPSCVGVSITVVVGGDPFTATASLPRQAGADRRAVRHARQRDGAQRRPVVHDARCRGWSLQARARMEVAAGRAGAPISSVAEMVMVMGLD